MNFARTSIQMIWLTACSLCTFVHGQDQDGSVKNSKSLSLTGIVRVAQTKAPAPDVMVEANGPSPAEATSDAEGRFALNVEKPGLYRIVSRGDGYGRTAIGTLSFPRVIRLEAGQGVKDLVIEVDSESSLSGRILDSEQEPVTGVSVRVFSRFFARGRPSYSSVGSARTDDRGQFRIGGLGSGEYYLGTAGRILKAQAPSNVKPDRQAQLTDIGVFYPAERSLESASPIVLRAGEQRGGLELRLRQHETHCVAASTDGFRGSNPVGIHLTAVGTGWTSMVAMDQVAPRKPFQICGIPSGDYRLEAYTPKDGGLAESSWNSFSLGHTDVDLGMLSGSGAVSSSGSIVLTGKKEGETLPTGLSVELLTKDRIPWKGETRSAAVSASGSFTLETLYPSEYWISVKGLPPPYYVRSIQAGPYEGTKRPIRPVSDEIRIAIGNNGGSVSGEAVSEEGNPVANSFVVIAPASFEAEGFSNQCRVQQTDQSGYFRIESLPPGDYTVNGFTDLRFGEGENPQFLRSFLNKAVSLTLPQDGAKTVKVRVLSPYQRQ